MKRNFTFTLCILLAVLFALGSTCDSFAKYDLVDRKGYTDNYQRTQILGYMQKASEKGYSIVIVLDSFLHDNDYQRQKYTEEYYASKGYNDEGIMLYVGIESRSYDIYSSHKNSFSEISERELDRIDDAVYNALHNDDFSGAAVIFAEYAYSSIISGGSETYYRGGKTASEIAFGIFLSFLLAFVIAIIILFIMKSKMKMLKPQGAAGNYINRKTIHVKSTSDRFLYSTVTKIRRESSSSGGGSSRSSGGSHRGGRF